MNKIKLFHVNDNGEEMTNDWFGMNPDIEVVSIRIVESRVCEYRYIIVVHYKEEPK